MKRIVGNIVPFLMAALIGIAASATPEAYAQYRCQGWGYQQDLHTLHATEYQGSIPQLTSIAVSQVWRVYCVQNSANNACRYCWIYKLYEWDYPLGYWVHIASSQIFSQDVDCADNDLLNASYDFEDFPEGGVYRVELTVSCPSNTYDSCAYDLIHSPEWWGYYNLQEP